MDIKKMCLVYKNYEDDDLHTGEMVAKLLKIKGLIAGVWLGGKDRYDQVGTDNFVVVNACNEVHTNPNYIDMGNDRDVLTYTDSDTFLAKVKSRL